MIFCPRMRATSTSSPPQLCRSRRSPWPAESRDGSSTVTNENPMGGHPGRHDAAGRHVERVAPIHHRQRRRDCRGLDRAGSPRSRSRTASDWARRPSNTGSPPPPIPSMSGLRSGGRELPTSRSSTYRASRPFANCKVRSTRASDCSSRRALHRGRLRPATGPSGPRSRG